METYCGMLLDRILNVKPHKRVDAYENKESGEYLKKFTVVVKQNDKDEVQCEFVFGAKVDERNKFIKYEGAITDFASDRTMLIDFEREYENVCVSAEEIQRDIYRFIGGVVTGKTKL